MAGKDNKIVASICPLCKKRLDGAFSAEGHSPSEGDISICLYCAEILVFDKGLLLQAITKEIREEYQRQGVWGQVMKFQTTILERIQGAGHA